MGVGEPVPMSGTRSPAWAEAMQLIDKKRVNEINFLKEAGARCIGNSHVRSRDRAGPGGGRSGQRRDAEGVTRAKIAERSS